MKILLVEDDVRVAGLIKRGLDENEFQTAIAYDGISGKKMALQHDFDLIITDIVLPKMDGLDLCKEIRHVKPDVPIIMLTALGTTDDKIEGFDARADDYLVKPFEMRELLARIRVLLKRYQKQDTLTGTILRYGDLEMNLHTKSVKRNTVEIHLTPKRVQVTPLFIAESRACPFQNGNC